MSSRGPIKNTIAPADDRARSGSRSVCGKDCEYSSRGRQALTAQLLGSRTVTRHYVAWTSNASPTETTTDNRLERRSFARMMLRPITATKLLIARRDRRSFCSSALRNCDGACCDGFHRRQSAEGTCRGIYRRRTSGRSRFHEKVIGCVGCEAGQSEGMRRRIGRVATRRPCGLCRTKEVSNLRVGGPIRRPSDGRAG
jgi:hypothetical protein